MSRFLLGLMVALLISRLVPIHAGSAPEDLLLSAAKTAADKDDLIGLQAIETKALLTDSDAKRQGSRLTLKLSSGANANKTYQDKPECASSSDSKCSRYKLIAHAHTRGVFVLAKLYSESVEFLLVDDSSGDETVLRQVPMLSPSGNHVLVLLVNDEQLGFGVQIWRREGHRFVLDWTGAPHVAGIYTSYKLIKWRSENTIELQSEVSFEPPKPNIINRFVLHRAASGWAVADSS